MLAGDARLLEKLRREELIPLGPRIRTRLATEAATREELLACLEHLLTAPGNASLMTRELRQTRRSDPPTPLPRRSLHYSRRTSITDRANRTIKYRGASHENARSSPEAIGCTSVGYP